MKKTKKWIYPLIISGILLTPAFSVNALTKKETVYTNLNYSGTTLKSSVTNHLFVREQKEIADETELKNILNINGLETYTMKEDQIIWSGNNKDIFYRGSIEKDLPIEVTLEYFLDGELVDAKDILGKSGDIKIKIHFKNNEENTVLVNGKHTKMYTPFVITLGMILDGENNQDLEINNGKIVDSGTKNIIVGIASPGMYDNFKLEELESLEDITISYKTTNFETTDIYMVATPKMLEDTDFKIFDKMNSLSKNLDTLKESIDTIENGAKELESGSKTLASGSSEMSTNLKTALEAVRKLEAGSKELKKEVDTAVSSLNKAAESIKSANVANSLAGLNTLKEKNKSAKNALINTLTTKTNMDYQTLMNYYKTTLVNYNGTEENILTLKANCELILLLDANETTYDTLINKLTPILKQVESLTSYLTKINELQKGVNELNGGLTQVNNGLTKLYDGSKTLTNGASTLQNELTTLTNGISKFNKEGITPLTKYGSTIKSYSNKAKALVNLSKEYNGFSSNNVTNTTFVYKIEKVK